MKLVVDGDSFAPGEVIRGRVVIEKGGLQEVQVGLLFREEAEGGMVEATTEQILDESFEGSGDLAAGTAIPFAIPVPADAPPNIRTQHGSLFWEVVARTDHVSEDPLQSQRVEITPPLR